MCICSALFYRAILFQSVYTNLDSRAVEQNSNCLIFTEAYLFIFFTLFCWCYTGNLTEILISISPMANDVYVASFSVLTGFWKAFFEVLT